MPLVEIDPKVAPRRGTPVTVGNVYQHPWGRPFFKVVMGVVDTSMRVQGRKRWNNVIMLHLTIEGEVIGCSAAPEAYVSNHNDLIGKIVEMPKMKLEWFTSPSPSKSPASSRGKGRASASSKESEKS